MKVKAVRAKLADKKCLYCEHWQGDMYFAETLRLLGSTEIIANCIKHRVAVRDDSPACSSFDWRKKHNG